MRESLHQLNLSALITADCAGLRLDQALAKAFPDYSRSCLQSWLKKGFVQLDEQVVTKQRTIVIGGEQITVVANIQAAENWQAQEIPLSIVAEDESLLIINKPSGLVVHPAAGNPEGTLVNGLLNYDPELAALPRAGIIHRLDKETTGLLVVARTLTAHNHLVSHLQARTIKREYDAVVKGNMISGGTVDAAIGRHPTVRTQMTVLGNGKPAVTHYRIGQRFRTHTQLQVQLETGRTHQIRVHMNHIGYPIVGDSTYGGRLQIPAGASDDLTAVLRKFRRQALHARRLTLEHPLSGETMTYEAPLPNDMQTLIDLLAVDTEQHNE